MINHPSRYNKKLLPIFAKMLSECVWVFDPFAGTGERLLELKNNYLPNTNIFGTEIEREWANTTNIVAHSDCLFVLNWLSDNSWDAILTSPVYGNRMSDHHNAKDGSIRNTYTHKLGHSLSENNSGKLQWGEEYRNFHKQVWKECHRVLKPNGKFILNIKDHIRKGVVQPVTDWHISALLEIGFQIIENRKIELSSNHQGQNGNIRVPYESVICFVKY